MTSKLGDITSLAKKLQINEQKNDNTNAEVISSDIKENNIGYQCKGKGHTVFDGCEPDEIQLFVEYYEGNPRSVEENQTNSNINAVNSVFDKNCEVDRLGEFIFVPLPTLLTQFVLNYSARDVKEENQELLTSICFVPKNIHNSMPLANSKKHIELPNEPCFSMKQRALSKKSKILSMKSLDELPHNVLDCVRYCVLPALYIPQYELCITGLCSVLRYLLQHSHNVKGQNSPLLGFQNACLSAPAEVSLWTRFCEIDLPKATKCVQNTTLESLSQGTIPLPEEFAKFEMHLNQPIRMFNIRKRMQKAEKSNEFPINSHAKRAEKLNGNNDSDAIKIFAQTQHVYAEGPDCLLSDIVLFLHYYVSFHASSFKSNLKIWEKVIPKTVKWFDKVGKHGALNVAQNLVHSVDQFIDIDNHEFFLPPVPEQSLYKSDPKRHNTSSKIFTRSNKGTMFQLNFYSSCILIT